MAITFDVTVGSRLNCCIIFWKPFSLGLLWNQYSVTRRYDLDPTVGSRSNVCTSFLKLFSFGLIWNPNSMTRMSRRPDLSDGSKWPKLSIRPLDRA